MGKTKMQLIKTGICEECGKKIYRRGAYSPSGQGDYEATVFAGIPFIFAKYGFGSISDCYLAINEINELLKLC